MIFGKGGQSLLKKWQSEGTKTFLGIHSNGFPNLFIVTGPQGGGGSFNFTEAIETHSDYLIWILETMRDQGAGVVDIKKEHENEYAEHCRAVDISTSAFRDCISYYNGEGKAEPGSLSYYGGNQWHKYRANAEQTLDPYIFK